MNVKLNISSYLSRCNITFETLRPILSYLISDNNGHACMTTSIAIVCPRTLLWVRTSSQTRDSMRKGVRAADNSCHSEEGRESILAATESEKSGQRLSPTKDFWRVQQPENKKKEKSRTLMISWRMFLLPVTCVMCPDYAKTTKDTLTP